MIKSDKQYPLTDQTSRVGILIIALWFGLVTGLGEVFIRTFQKFVLGEFIYLSPHVTWMAPLADTLLFVFAGGILLLITRRWPKLVSLRIATFVFAVMTFLGPLLWYPKVHHYAALLLAIGLAVEVSRLVAAHSNAFNLLVLRTTGWMVALIVVMALAVHGWPIVKERVALAKLPPPSSNAPNVLLIVLDTVRAKSLALYGYARPTTPNLNELAKSGVVFERALSTSPWTLPSHASMFTGRFPNELSATWRTPLDGTYPTLAETFRANGYLTAGFVGNFLAGTYESGLNRGFIHYKDYPVSFEMVVRSSWLARSILGHYRLRGNAEEVKYSFLHWLAQTSQRPFFAFVNFMDAHDPYLPPAPFNLKFLSKPLKDSSIVEGHRYTREQIQELRDAYEGAIAYLDYQVGLLLDELKKRGVLENTVVVITSDHGEQFGEHDLMGHANSLYRSLLHVPLLISFPTRVPAGRRIHETVTLRDIAATLVDIVKLKNGPRLPGNSLAGYWNGGHEFTTSKTVLLSEVRKGINLAEWLPVMRGDMKSLVIDGKQYIRNGDGREELYDFENDPEEERNLASSEESRGMLKQFRATLDLIDRHRKP